VVLTTAVVIDTDPALPRAAVVAEAEADTHLRPTTTTTTAVALLVVTAPAGMTTAAAHPRASSMIGVKEVMAARRLVVACLMSMALRTRVTLTILIMLGPDLLLVVTMTRT
jgi:hypothetical protein